MPNIKQIYVGTNLVRPYKKIECDFTQSANGFTYYGVVGSPSYSRNSTYGLYGYKSSGNFLAVARKVPSSIYSQGELMKAEITLGSTLNRGGGGLSKGVDTNIARTYLNGDLQSVLQRNFGVSLTETTLSSNTPANTDYSIIIDTTGKKMYLSYEPGTIMTLTDTMISSLKSEWASGNMNVCALGYRTSGTVYFYIKKAVFYVN